MAKEPLDALPLWLLFATLCALAALALEGGYRLGRWRRARSEEEEKETPVGAMVGSILALFAFLLAFTFGMAASRFEARRETVLEEANAIGTAYLRTRLIPEPQRGESARLLREYVDVRLTAIQRGELEAAIARSEEIHTLLWAQAAQAADKDRGPIMGLYIQSLNQMIDLHAKRLQVGLRNRIPETIWAGLGGIALLAMLSVGYQAGLAATRRSPAMLGVVVAFATVLTLIADLDRAYSGLITVSQQSLVDLQKSINGAEHPPVN
ncbi:MAG TPA: hypothetical protein VLM40_10955 [Gemmata sp.]|nr:hypothetical protein [Gemmata sp.]